MPAQVHRVQAAARAGFLWEMTGHKPGAAQAFETFGCGTGLTIQDAAHQERSREHNTRWLAWLTEEIGKLGLTVTPSVANFVLIHFPTEKGRTSDEADAFLTKRGLVLRALKNYGLPHALRMTIGTEEANRLVVEGLRDFMGAK